MIYFMAEIKPGGQQSRGLSKDSTELLMHEGRTSGNSIGVGKSVETGRVGALDRGALNVACRF